MASFSGPEPIADHILATLEAQMPTKIAGINAATQDFTLPGIQAYYLGDSDGKYVWPSIAISETDPESLAVYSGGAYMAYPFEIAALNVDTGGGYQQMVRSLWRYQRCIVEILYEHRYQEDYWLDINGIALMHRGPWPVDEHQGFALIKGVRAWFGSIEEH